MLTYNAVHNAPANNLNMCSLMHAIESDSIHHINWIYACGHNDYNHYDMVNMESCLANDKDLLIH